MQFCYFSRFFLDESMRSLQNAFTRDDMTAWWEERREVEDTMVREGKVRYGDTVNRSINDFTHRILMQIFKKKLEFMLNIEWVR